MRAPPTIIAVTWSADEPQDFHVAPGFREGEVKAVLAELRADAELEGASVERLLREALFRIRPVAAR